jgi:hypothetical protein
MILFYYLFSFDWSFVYSSDHGSNYDPVRDVLLRDNSRGGPSGGGPSGGGPSNNQNPDNLLKEKITDTKKLYDFLDWFKNKQIRDTGMDFKNITSSFVATTNEEIELKEMTRIFSHFKRSEDASLHYSSSALHNPGRIKIDYKLLNILKELNKDYPQGWPGRSR